MWQLQCKYVSKTVFKLIVDYNSETLNFASDKFSSCYSMVLIRLFFVLFFFSHKPLILIHSHQCAYSPHWGSYLSNSNDRRICLWITSCVSSQSFRCDLSLVYEGKQGIIEEDFACFLPNKWCMWEWSSD